MITSECITDLNFLRPAARPRVFFKSHSPSVEWTTRAHVSTLFVSKAARTSFLHEECFPRLVARDEVIPTDELRPSLAGSADLVRCVVELASSRKLRASLRVMRFGDHGLSHGPGIASRSIREASA